MKGGIWRFCGELQEQLHRNLPTEKGQALVGAAVGGIEAMLGSLLSGGISHPVQYLQTSTRDSPAFPVLFANAASELPPWHTVFPCAALLVDSSVSDQILH